MVYFACACVCKCELQSTFQLHIKSNSSLVTLNQFQIDNLLFYMTKFLTFTVLSDISSDNQILLVVYSENPVPYSIFKHWFHSVPVGGSRDLRQQPWTTLCSCM